MAPGLTLVLGGARSGKSAWAEALVGTYARPRVYVATAQAFDDEMASRIATHRARRASTWQTVDAPDALAATLRSQPAEAAVLVDCATMWLSNRLLADAAMEDEIVDLLAALAACPAPVVVVSNEVGQGIVPDNPLARRFRDLQGGLNRRIAEQADLVVAVMAGLPLALKGRIPDGLA